MLSLTCKIAIKAVIYLAAKSASEKKSGILEVAEYIDASEHTVGKILQLLVHEEIINSTKGPNGGFSITPKQRAQPVIKIIEAVDGKEVFKECGLGLSKCSSTHPCPIHEDYKEIRNQFEKLCREKSIDDLCKPLNHGSTYLVG